MQSIKRYKNKNNKSAIIAFALVLLILVLTAGFSAFSATLNISALAMIRPQKDIRITNISKTTITQQAYSNWEEYDVSSILASLALPNADSTITYDVTVTNIGNIEMGILSVTGLPNNLTYSISNYNVKDILCDDTDSTKCKLGSETTLHITIGYANNGYNSNNVNYNIQMDFDFKEVYSITYNGFANVTDLPKTILNGETKTITFNSTTGIPFDVATNNATGNYVNPALTLSNAQDNVTITRYYSVTYSDFTGNTSGLISRIEPGGATITFDSTTGIPEFVIVTGAVNSYNSNTHELILTNVNSNVNVTMAYDGNVEITSITRYAVSNIVENSNPQIANNGQNITFDLGITVDENNYNEDFYITYAIVINNDSVYEQKVMATNFTPNIVGSGNVPSVTYNITDANGNQVLNTMIAPKTSETYYLTITMEPQEEGSWSIEGESSVDTAENGAVSGTITGNTQGNLSGTNTLAHFTAKIANTFEENKNFIISIDDNKFKIVDSSGNDISTMSITANTADTYDFYIKNLNGNNFVSSPYSLNININYDSIASSIGDVSLVVDIDSTITDNTAPVISNVTAQITSAQKEILVTWTGTDDNRIVNYYVETYNSDASGNGTPTNTATLSGGANGAQVSYTATVTNDDAYYYFKVYAIDQSNNIASSQEIATCTTSSGHCSRTANAKYKWNFTVTLILTNATSSKGTTVVNESTRTVTFNATYDSNIDTTLSGASDNYNAPTSINTARITYANGTTANLTSGSSSTASYSYNTNSHVLNIYHITGDIRITAEGQSTGCLAEGTDILMADGSYKKIENVGYDDLLAVWNYDTGELTYEYPLWIENEHTANKITRVTFSDDTHIDFVLNHAIYDTDKNMFVDILDENNFKIGSHVAKLKNNELTSVTVTNIEQINKEVKYYFVGSTTYYNIFANDILTTDYNLIISNLYGFDDNAKWPKGKEQILANKDNLLNYSHFEDVLPYYLYKGFRVEEAGYLVNNNVTTIDEFKKYITTLIINQSMLESPITINNNRYWMVTTSEDVINNSNKKSFLRKEGSIYTLPKLNKQNFKGWYNTSDNNVYKPGDKIIVTHGIHLNAVYENDNQSIGLLGIEYLNYENQFMTTLK